ncbi:MAG: hypothetical protein EXR76_18905 [Myxococcales bacterium]|nr:hypothetical protein [Myxococcales bacterium]
MTVEKWVTTVPAITLVEGELLGVVALGHALVLIRHEGRLYAFPDQCPHRGAPFSTAGRLSGGLLLCGWHNWTFHLDTGCQTHLDSVCLEAVPIRERDGHLEVFVKET